MTCDFCDNRRFDVPVEKLDGGNAGAKPAVVAKEGKAPRQYR